MYNSSEILNLSIVVNTPVLLNCKFCYCCIIPDWTYQVPYETESSIMLSLITLAQAQQSKTDSLFGLLGLNVHILHWNATHKGLRCVPNRTLV